MTPKTFEARCLRLPAATKVVQWDGTSVFKVGGKMFALGGGFAAGSGGYMFKVSDMAFAMLIDMAWHDRRPTWRAPNGCSSPATTHFPMRNSPPIWRRPMP